MDLSNPQWRKSSYSGKENCVEVALGAEVVGVRDTKNPTGGSLVLPELGWRSLLAAAMR